MVRLLGNWPPLAGDEVELEGVSSESISVSEWGSATLTVSYDGVIQDCTTGFGDGGFLATCPAPAIGAIAEMRLTSEGVGDAAGRTPAVQTFTLPATAAGVIWVRPLVLPDFTPGEGT